MSSQERFYVKFERSGGFAGLTRTVEIDSDTLSGDDQKAMLKLIEDSNFFSDDFASLPDGVRDGYSYEITIEKGGERRTINIDDSGISEDLRPLVDQLVGIMRRSSR
jgi:hypothetical protein